MEIYVGAVSILNEHQIRQRPKDGAVPRLGAPSSGVLNQKAADQQHLRAHDDAAADHIATIAFQQRRFSKANHAPGRKRRLADPPALKLAPVELVSVA